MRKFVSLFLSTLIILGSLTSCGYVVIGEEVKETEPVRIETTVRESDADLSEETTAENVAETTENATESHYTFNPHVCSQFMTELMGEEMRDTYYNLVDCVLAGETSFACPNKETFDWVLGQCPYLLFPVIGEYITEAEGISYEDGIAYIRYKIPYEEFKVKLQEFEDITVNILNEVLDDDYSDFEKAFAIYQYFVTHYAYDYYAEEHLGEPEIDEMLSGYRLLTQGIGICQEISVAYSFLLLEAGVDATVMKGVRNYDNAHHQWSFITLDGNYYHVDPTFGLGFAESLAYFLMTDKDRLENDGFDPADYIPCSVYAQNHEYPDITAADDTFSHFRISSFLEWNSDENKILCEDSYGTTSWFEYGDK